MLTSLQKDVLVEILNTQIGYAASLLSEIVNEKIILSVPNIQLDTGESINLQYYQENGGIKPGNSVMSSITFGNDFNGNAFIFFPIDKAKVLVNSCLGLKPDAGLNNGKIDFSSEDMDVIRELCNIIFNSIIGEFGNLLNLRLECTTPEMELAMVSTVDQESWIPDDLNVLALYTSFTLLESKIKGVILIALTVDSVNMLLNKIDEMLDDVL